MAAAVSCGHPVPQIQPFSSALPSPSFSLAASGHDPPLVNEKITGLPSLPPSPVARLYRILIFLSSKACLDPFFLPVASYGPPGFLTIPPFLPARDDDPLIFYGPSLNGIGRNFHVSFSFPILRHRYSLLPIRCVVGELFCVATSISPVRQIPAYSSCPSPFPFLRFSLSRKDFPLSVLDKAEGFPFRT